MTGKPLSTLIMDRTPTSPTIAKRTKNASSLILTRDMQVTQHPPKSLVKIGLASLGRRLTLLCRALLLEDLFEDRRRSSSESVVLCRESRLAKSVRSTEESSWPGSTGVSSIGCGAQREPQRETMAKGYIVICSSSTQSTQRPMNSPNSRRGSSTLPRFTRKLVAEQIDVVTQEAPLFLKSHEIWRMACSGGDSWLKESSCSWSAQLEMYHPSVRTKIKSEPIPIITKSEIVFMMLASFRPEICLNKT
mmetsp:Transcript_82656/g.233859  ORF Transcript_82656/g.233859 Transcript_82656/m.233859 type:complete len:248 (+) Transcript_82656:2523-3266(+)